MAGASPRQVDSKISSGSGTVESHDCCGESERWDWVTNARDARRGGRTATRRSCSSMLERALVTRGGDRAAGWGWKAGTKNKAEF
jgi:hypothetical protein